MVTMGGNGCCAGEIRKIQIFPPTGQPPRIYYDLSKNFRVKQVREKLKKSQGTFERCTTLWGSRNQPPHFTTTLILGQTAHAKSTLEIILYIGL